MTSLVAWLDHWQALLGSILGGIVALLAALVVAHGQTRREQRAAATLLIADLLAVVAASRNLSTIATRNGVSEKDYPTWLAGRLSSRQPKLSHHFEAEMVRVIDMNTSLAAHLSLFKTTFSTIEDVITRLKGHFDLERRGILISSSPPGQFTADVQVLHRAFNLSARHAEYAIHYLESLVLSSIPTFTRIRMFFWPSATEKQSRELLEKGNI
ncbi:MAG: hypothetical protein HYU77_05455 [Betaproteobacteria bacterium]|nr:hypothetical protein [Betaproteobacteria bacterium]